MRIAISGCSSQGKTTLMNALFEVDEFKHFKKVSSPTRILQQEGFSINEEGNEKTQLLIMMQHFKNVLQYQENSFFDRCALDGLAYSMFFYDKIKISGFEKLLINLFEHTIKQYSIIFYIVPELPIIDDNTRSLNMHFFNSTKDYFNTIISRYNIPVIYLQGTVKERVEIVKKYANILNNELSNG